MEALTKEVTFASPRLALIFKGLRLEHEVGDFVLKRADGLCPRLALIFKGLRQGGASFDVMEVVLDLP